MNLDTVSKLVVEHQTGETQKLRKEDDDKLAVRRMYRWLMWGLLVVLIASVMLAASKAFELDRSVSFVAVCLLLGGLAASASGVMSTITSGAWQAKKPFRVRETSEIESRKLQEELPDKGIPVPAVSVTERTTQLIPRADSREFDKL